MLVVHLCHCSVLTTLVWLGPTPSNHHHTSFERPTSCTISLISTPLDTASICRSHNFLSFTWAFLMPWRFYAFWVDLPAIGNCWIGFYALTLNRAPRLGPKGASADKTAGLRAQGLSPLEIALVHQLYIITTIILHHPYNLSLVFAAVIKR